VSDTDKGALTGAFITGAAIGMATAILIAPKSGKETREEIKRNLGDAKDKINETISNGSETAKSKLSEAVSTTKTVAKEGKRAAQEAKERVKQQKGNEPIDEEDETEQG
jgi:gas vesicle protein